MALNYHILPLLTSLICLEIVLALSSPYGKDETSSIIGGHSVGKFFQEKESVKVLHDGEYPYFVSLEYRGVQICGGSIIRSNLVLTAAHCFKGLDISELKVRAGIYMREELKYGQLRDVKDIKANALYKIFCKKCDIGLIRLKKPFKLNKFVNIINMPQSKQKNSFIGEQLTVIGFGELASGRLPNGLQTATVKVISNRECRRIIGTSDGIPKSYLCTLGVEGDKGVCDGDSGGPLVRHIPGKPSQDLLIGIIAFARRTEELKCDASLPSGHTEVAASRSWIDRNLNEKSWIVETTDL